VVIRNPELDQSRIESVDFRGSRTGISESASRISAFSRSDRFLIDGLSSASGTLLIDGFHSGEGSFSIIAADGRREARTYILDMNFLDLRIDKGRVETARNFRSGVFGAVSYESTLTRNGSGPVANGTSIVNGTLEFTGDGTALMRFLDTFDLLRLRLESGQVFDDDEFEGRIVQVELQNSRFRLANGQWIRVTEQTEIDNDGDFISLAGVATALQNGIRVIAEGDYYQPDPEEKLWIVTQVEFNTESNEFKDLVAQVDTGQQMFTLVNGDAFYLVQTSEIDNNGDFMTLEAVADALSAGLPVVAEGEFIIESETGRAIADEVEFRLAIHEFEEKVTGVNPAGMLFTIESGKQVMITENTIISDGGDLFTLAEVQAALDSGETVEADGKYYISPGASFWIATEVEFELADTDDDDD
jgi:hypothetical protein